MERRTDAQVAEKLGELNGSVKAMHETLVARIDDIRQESNRRMDDIREDIRRLQESQNKRMDRIEQSVTEQVGQLREDMNKRIDGLGTRVTNLEAEDKRLIEKTAKLSAVGGGVGGALAAAAVELIKRL